MSHTITCQEVAEAYIEERIVPGAVDGAEYGAGPQELHYVATVGKEAELTPMVYVAGFNDVFKSFDNKRGLAEKLAGHGLGMIVAENDRGPMRRNQAGHPDAMATQAHNVLSVIEAENLPDTTLPIAGHSMGGMVMTAAIAEARRRGWTCFDNAPVAYLATAGVSRAETVATLGSRFAAGLVLDKNVGDLVLEAALDADHSLQQSVHSGWRSARSNLPRAAREVYEIGTRRIHLDAVASVVGRVGVFNYAQDMLQPSRLVDPVIAELFARADAPLNLSYHTPYSTDLDAAGAVVGARGAHHLDCVTYPARVAGAVGQFMRES